MTSKQFRKYVLLLIVILGHISTTTSSNKFALISGDKPLNIYIEKNEAPVVLSALEMFQNDIKTVSKTSPLINNEISLKESLIIGTLGKNSFIDQLIKEKVISINKIEGKWEAFQIQTINYKNKKHLIVIGSDNRGTAYGILELSRTIGVSPWVWWADSAPEKKQSVDISEDYFVIQSPSVQYRGIFLNDEDWGLMPWSSKNYEQTGNIGQIGPKTYSRIFELLLRLRANTLWPAMHESTIPFYFVEGNKEMADKYGIVLGTSHCEPLMRNNAGEWNSKTLGEYNYLTNKPQILDYWSERLSETNKSENFYTIGMRGVHDGHMEGVKTLEEQTNILSQVITDQRNLLETYTHTEINKIPQAFIPYKEVLSVYENNLELPEDVTLVWCDDNYGYLTRLSNDEEQLRNGGAGIYYHISYWGRPHDYLWLSSTQPALIYNQMKKAWDANARKLWILNVGDIKPAEYNIEFFLDMAWNINSVNEKSIYKHQYKWLEREFGANVAHKIAPAIQEYYRLANIRKPEFMGWSRVEEYGAIKGGKTPVIDTEFSPYNFGDEIYNRIQDYNIISNIAKETEQLIPQDKKSAFFQLVTYPICASAEMNKKLLYAQKARLYAKECLPLAKEYEQLSNDAYNTISALTHQYNRDISNKKWDGMMDMKPRNLAVFEKMNDLELSYPSNNKNTLTSPDKKIDTNKNENSTTLEQFKKNIHESTFISLIDSDKNHTIWSIESKPEWINIEEEVLPVRHEKRINITPNWDKLDNASEGEIRLNIDGQIYPFTVSASKDNMPKATEVYRTIALNGSDFTRNGKTSPLATEGLGHSMNAISLEKGKDNFIEFDIYTESNGDAIINTHFIPNHPTTNSDIRYAISVDNQTPQIVSLKTEFRSEQWKINVLRNQAVGSTKHHIEESGKHTIRIYALDDDIILDQLMLTFDQDLKYYQVPTKH